MPKKLTKCEHCGKKFKSIKGHLLHCKVLAEQSKIRNEYQSHKTNVLEQGRTEGLQEAKREQAFRGKDAIIQLTECIAKMNQALAQVVGEWRW